LSSLGFNESSKTVSLIFVMFYGAISSYENRTVTRPVFETSVILAFKLRLSLSGRFSTSVGRNIED